jgi:hypothetical protein
MGFYTGDGIGTGGSGGSSTPTDVNYTNLTPMAAAYRGFNAGQTFNNVPIQDVLDGILYPYQAPTFSAFSISGQTSPLEVGNEIIAGSKNFVWTTTNPSNINPNTIKITDVTGGNIDLATALANDGNEAIVIGAIQKLTSVSHTFRIVGTNTNLVNFQRDYSVAWQWRMYWGFSPLTSITSADILGFGGSKLATARTGTITLPTNTGTNYDYICYPDSWGLISNIIDIGSGFSLTAAYTNEGTLVHTNAFGASETYRIYKSTTASAGKTGWNLSIS